MGMNMKSMNVTRREFLQSSSALVVGVSGVLPTLDVQAQNVAPKILGPNPSNLDFKVYRANSLQVGLKAEDCEI